MESSLSNHARYGNHWLWVASLVMPANMDPAWPVLVFESDGFCQQVRSPSDVSDLYETEYWDEVAAAFDALHRRIEVSHTTERTLMSAVSARDDVCFRNWAEKALARMWRTTRFRVKRATAEQDVWIKTLSTDALWQELIQRTRSQ